MKNRITHLLNDWVPRPAEAEPTGPEDHPVRERPPLAPYRMPRSVNMLMPVELCVNRNLLVSLISASITEISRHREDEPAVTSGRDLAEMEAALHQQLAFRTWLKGHPSNYICIALYPVSGANPLDDLDDLGDPPS